MQQGYKCPRCNSPINYGAQSCNNCGQPFNWKEQRHPGELSQYKAEHYRINWFQQHLNWTLTFAIILLLSLNGFALIKKEDMSMYVYFVFFILLLLTLAIFMITGGFVLTQKGRSLWYLALILIPGVGFFVAPITWLCLSNISRQKASIDTKPESDLDKVYKAEPPKKKVNADLIGCLVAIVLVLIYLAWAIATCSG